MLVAGLIALITAIFLGGPGEIFYVDNLEKGIKKHVVEKERKKDILKDIKYTKSIFKDFEKERKKDFKEFLEIYIDKNTTSEQLNSFFEELQNNRSGFQSKIVDQRLLIFAKIQPEEWSNILESSETIAGKRIAKVEKKTSKGKEYNAKTKSLIESIITDNNQKTNLTVGLADVTKSTKDLEGLLLTINSAQNKILADKNSGKDELLEIITDDNNQRKPVLESLVNFHKIAKENCSDVEWDKIMKTFLKEIQMSSR